MSDLNLLLPTGWSTYTRIDHQLDFSPAQWAGPRGQRDIGLHREIEKGENIEFQCIALESTNVRLYSSMNTGDDRTPLLSHFVQDMLQMLHCEQEILPTMTPCFTTVDRRC